MTEFEIDLQLFAVVNLPDNPDASNKATAGKDYKIYINTGTVAVPIWTKVGGQRNSPLNQTTDTIDVTHKESGGYKSTIAGLKGWDISLDGLAILDDPGVDAIEYAYDNSKQVNIKFERPDLKYKTGWASVSEFSLDVGHDAEATISGSLQGVGPISAWTTPVPTISPLNVTVSKATATDQTFTISPANTAVTSVSNGATPITVMTNYTYSAGILVIKGTYLAGLTAGTITFNVLTGNAETLTFTVTLTA